jgi:acyl transferase domain-containing protein
MSMVDQQLLSPDGSCKTFSAEANGYARGEAITAVYVKRLSDALKDGNPIRAIIRATAANHDGRTHGMSLPSSEAQESLIRKAYKKAGIQDSSQTAFFECHGTGTQAGDKIETTAVASVFGESGIHVGSIKASFGHTEGAAGILGVIKAVLSLMHRTIPPQIKCFPPNPAIPFKTGKLIVPTEPTPWPENRLEHVSVNSFGVGGSNAHAILESASSLAASRTLKDPERVVADAELLLLSANSPWSLDVLIQSYKDYVHAGNDVHDLAYTLGRGRKHLSQRAFAIASQGSFENSPLVGQPGRSSSVVMIFTGQGAQWPGMGSELMRSNEVFRSSIRLLDKHLANLQVPWTIEGELSRMGKESRLHTAEISQPLCTAVQVALVDAFSSIGIIPNAVIGHSSGEIAAAYAASALTAQEAITTAVYRGQAATKQTKQGAMAAIGMGREEALAHIADVSNVCIACDNSPRSVTISGDAEQVVIAIAIIRKAKPDTFVRELSVDKAYHSHHMIECSKEYLHLMDGKLVGRPAGLPFYSSVTGDLLEQSVPLDKLYWLRNLQSEVQFYPAVASLLKSQRANGACFLEIGPHSALQGPLAQISSHLSVSMPYTSAMIRNQNSHEALLTAIGKLYTYHVPIDLKSLYPVGLLLPDLPRYPYDHENRQFWYESRLSKENRQRKFPHHDLLGSKLPESTDHEPTWRNILHVDYATAWLRDHRVESNVVFPFAGYVAMAGEAVRQLSGVNEGFRMRHVLVTTALVLTEDKPTEIMTTVRSARLTDTAESKWYEFTISAHNGHQWIKHCTGQAMSHVEAKTKGTNVSFQSFLREVDAKKWFHSLDGAGLGLGPAFQNLVNISTDTTTLRAVGRVIRNPDLKLEKYCIHPAELDSALQLCGISFTNGQPRKLKNWLPIKCDEIVISRNSLDMQVAASSYITSNSFLVGDIRAVADNQTVINISNLRMACLEKSSSPDDSSLTACARHYWAPDIDFVDVTTLLQPSTNLHRSSFFKTLAHCKPSLQILQLGGNHGSQPKEILQSLMLQNGHRLYKKYTFTSSSYIPEQDQLKGFAGLEYSTLNIESNALDQGFECGQYDLVFGSNIINDADNAVESLQNVRKLLRSDGFLIVMGLRSSDIEKNGSKLVEALQQAEFTTPKTLATDDACDALISRPQPRSSRPRLKRITLLYQENAAKTDIIVEALEVLGFEIDRCKVHDRPVSNQDIISVLDLHSPYFSDMNNDSFQTFKSFIRNISGSGIFWITKPSQIGSSDPIYSQVMGIARTIRSELLIDFATCEVDNVNSSVTQILSVFEKFLSRDKGEDITVKPEMEFSIRDGVVRIGRFYPFDLRDEMMDLGENHRDVLDAIVPGRLSSIQWTKQPALGALQPDEVEVEIYATGLNFRDVLVAMKLVEFSERVFGVEAAGIVRRTGSAVQNTRIGDRVAVAARYLMASVISTKEILCVKIPEALGFESAASMLTPFCTVIYSLINVGDLRRGQVGSYRVLAFICANS